eukprot:1587092-Rhodomonas_salina.3
MRSEASLCWCQGSDIRGAQALLGESCRPMTCAEQQEPPQLEGLRSTTRARDAGVRLATPRNQIQENTKP